MPPKNCELGPGQLFMVGPDGVEIFLASMSDGIPKVSIQYDGNLIEEVCGYEKYIPLLNHDDTFELEGKIMMNPNKVLYYLLMRSNNWLKMHGYPMLRKVRR